MTDAHTHGPASSVKPVKPLGTCCAESCRAVSRLKDAHLVCVCMHIMRQSKFEMASCNDVSACLET